MDITDEYVEVEKEILVSVSTKEQFKKTMSRIRGQFPKRWNRYGDGYTCGCSHDCCGCLTPYGRREYLLSTDETGFLQITILQDYTRNY